jgi:O-antigen/teichoic acid export membrane protein
MCTGDFLLVLGFGEKYSGNGATVSVAALSMLAQGIGLTAGIGLWAIERPKSNLVADLCTLVVTVAIVVCLLQPLGVLGAVLGDLGGRIAGTWIRIDTLSGLLKAT